MKTNKIIIIVLALLFVGSAAFAAAGDKLKISTNVPETEPVFKIEGSLDGSSSWTAGGTSDETINASVDISANDLTVYFRVIQTNTARCAKSYKIALTPTVLTHATVTTNATDSPKFKKQSNYNTVSTPLSVTPPTDDEVVATYEAQAVYTNTGPVEADTTILTMTYTWPKKESLPSGTYNGTVTLTITTST